MMIFEELLEYTKKSKILKKKNNRMLSPFIWYCVIHYSMLEDDLQNITKKCSLNDEWKKMPLNEKKEYEKLSEYYGYKAVSTS